MAAFAAEEQEREAGYPRLHDGLAVAGGAGRPARTLAVCLRIGDTESHAAAEPRDAVRSLAGPRARDTVAQE